MSSPLKVSRRDALKWGCIAGLAPIAGPVLASNAPMFDPLIRACGELHPIGNDLPLVEDVLSEEAGEETMLRGQEAAAVRVHPSWGRWNPRRVSEGRPLRVAFMQSDHLLNQVVIDAALEWQRHMALRFEFVGTYRGANNPGNLDILVTQELHRQQQQLGCSVARQGQQRHSVTTPATFHKRQYRNTDQRRRSARTRSRARAYPRTPKPRSQARLQRRSRPRLLQARVRME